MPKTNQILIPILILVLLIAGSAFYCFNRNEVKSGVIPSKPLTTAQAHSPEKTIASDSNSNTTQPTSKNITPATPITSDKSGVTGSSPTSQTSGSVATPSGNLVSNHHPNLSGTPAPSSEESVCNTTPGATCYIKFVQNGIVKTLAAQKVDGSGSSYWDWDVNKAGFGPGVWEITAIATLNGVNKSMTDPMSLEVKP